MPMPPSTPADTSATTARRLDWEVEPLSDQRWSKIEQVVFARLEREPEPTAERGWGRRQRVVLWVAAAATLGALVVMLGVGWGRWAAPEQAALSRISTGATPSHLALPGLSLDVSPESTIVVSGSEQSSTLVVLDRGEVACDVAPRRPGAPLVVQAGEVRVEVVGTRFRVARQGEAARVAVQEGVVKVSSRGQTVRVAAGESWPMLEPKRVEPATPSEALVPTKPDAAAEPRARGPRPVARAVPVEQSPVKLRALEVETEQQQFEAATRLERNDPGRAIQLYRGLQAGSGSWAMNALFAHGRLEAARGNKAEARRVLSQYLARFPQGGNAQDARMLLGRLE